jgi:pentatricopeptide repeat protein
MNHKRHRRRSPHSPPCSRWAPSISMPMLGWVLAVLLVRSVDAFLPIFYPTKILTTSRNGLVRSAERWQQGDRSARSGSPPVGTITKPRLAAVNRRTQLRWIFQSIVKLQQQSKSNPGPEAQPLLDAVAGLVQAHSPQQVLYAGTMLTALDLSRQPLAIQERVAKATAMTGLLHIALNLTDNMLKENILPSEVAQDAVSSGLRQTGRVHRLERFLLEVGRVAILHKQHVSQSSFNLYLAALCDAATDKDPESRRAPQNAVVLMDRACQWLSPKSSSYQTQALLGLMPDAVSYATVLHAAATLDNHTLSRHVWTYAQQCGVSPNINAYNARLAAVPNDTQALQLYETILQDRRVRLDRYTIDLVLLPLVRAGRIGDVESLLDRFVSNNSEHVVSQGFSAFLSTIIRGGDVASARAIFDTYMLPTLAAVIETDAGSMRLVRPQTRHFNILLEGYRKKYVGSRESSASSEVDDATAVICEEGWQLYALMVNSSRIVPDPFTVTSMMGLSRSPSELTDILDNAINGFGLNCSSVVLRAAVTAYGELGDPASACQLFADYVEQPVSTRNWNALLGAIAMGAGHNATKRLDLLSANVATKVGRDNSGKSKNKISDSIQGLRCWEAVKHLLGEIPDPTSQTYCIAAKALQYGSSNAITAEQLFRNATLAGISADGRFVNAVLRCFGGNVDAALKFWKDDCRGACIQHESRARFKSPSRSKGKNLIAAYNGLLYVCGRALRPDVALRLVYAMSKEGLEPDELSLNCYKSGKKIQQNMPANTRAKLAQSLKQTLNLVDSYEALLYIECMKYDQNDRRRTGEKRVRIIV